MTNKYDVLLLEEMGKENKYFPIDTIKAEAALIHDDWRQKFKRILNKGFKQLDGSIEIPIHVLNFDEKELINRYTQSKKTSDGFEVYYIQSALVKYHKQVIADDYDQLSAEQQHINDRLAYYKLSQLETDKSCANDSLINKITSGIARNEYLDTVQNIWHAIVLEVQ